MNQLVPYNFDTEMLPSVQEEIDGTQGVFFTLVPEALDMILEKALAWFAGREYIFLVDHGYTDKQGLGYIIFEWDSFSIDPLFLAILRDEEAVVDYSTYVRAEDD